MCSIREDILKIGHYFLLFAPPQRPQAAGVLKYIIYVPLVPKMHHTKFEKNWNSGYQEEVKNFQILTDR
jgi:hypothetical protein